MSARIEGLTERVRDDAAAARQRAAIAAARGRIERAVGPYRTALATLAAPDVATYERAAREVQPSASLARDVSALSETQRTAVNASLANAVVNGVVATADARELPPDGSPLRASLFDVLRRYVYTTAPLPRGGYVVAGITLDGDDDDDARDSTAQLVRTAVYDAFNVEYLVDAVRSALRRVHWSRDDDAYAAISMLPYALGAAQVLGAVDATLDALDRVVVADVVERARVFTVAAADLPFSTTVLVHTTRAREPAVRVRLLGTTGDVRTPLAPDGRVRFTTGQAGTYEFTVFDATDRVLATAVFTVRALAVCKRHGGEFDVGASGVHGECTWRAHPLTAAEAAYRQEAAFAALRARFRYSPALHAAYSPVLDTRAYSQAEIASLDVEGADRRRERLHTLPALLRRYLPIDAADGDVDADVLARFTSTPTSAAAELRRRARATATNAIEEQPLLPVAHALRGRLHPTERTFLDGVLLTIAARANAGEPDAVLWSTSDAARALPEGALVNDAAERRLDARIKAVLTTYATTGRAAVVDVWIGVHSAENDQPDAYTPAPVRARGSERIGVGVDTSEVHAYVERENYSEAACRLVNGLYRFAPLATLGPDFHALVAERLV